MKPAAGLNFTVIVMAKRPAPGRVKTRLTPPLSPGEAAGVHAAMLRCVLARLERWLPGRKVLALDREVAPQAVTQPRQARASGGIPGPIPGLDAAAWTIVRQGEGDLGRRMTRVWQDVGGGAVAFFGSDSPDVPGDVLARLPEALERHDAAAGPTHDGGYWTLLARSFDTAGVLLRDIDWGTPAVYDQTCAASRRHGLAFDELPTWHDVDTFDDLAALRRRLEAVPHDADRDPALARLLPELPHQGT